MSAEALKTVQNFLRIKQDYYTLTSVEINK